jgi:FtsZ-binding cell division protein ZapB
MNKDYAIYRTEKLSHYGNIAGSLHHTFRSIHTPNADMNKTKFNRVLCGSHNTNDVLSDIKNRISEITAKPRKNAVLAIEQLQTYSPDSKLSVDEWAKKNLEWNIKTFGKENVISSVLHLDESTPHIVSYIVPERDGKLNCREILGGRGKLSKLQTDYANEMKEFGLSRGEYGSKSSHRNIKKYYSSLNRNNKNYKKGVDKLKQKIDNFPTIKWHETSNQYMNRVNDSFDGLKKDFTKLIEHHGKLSTEIDNMENKMDNIIKENKQLKNENKELSNILESSLGELNLSKDDISVLRKIDISRIAERLNYFEEIPKKFNAIDLVKQVNNFDYETSVKWLYHEFGSDITGSIVANDVAIKEPERPFTKAENTIKNEVVKQLDALGCDKYRLTLQSDNSKPYLPGKPNCKDSLEYFYSKNDVINMIPFLLVKNNIDKMNILITPMDDNAYYILVDDCRKDLKSLINDGFKPCLYQSTSWNSYQSVFKLPKKYDREKEVLPLFNGMNKSFGDEKMTGLRHPFRLAGFRNMKPKHERENGTRPFVSIELAINRFCSKCIDMIDRRRKEFINQKKITKNDLSI